MVTWQITNIHIIAYFDTIFRIDQLAEVLLKDFIVNYNPESFAGLIIYHKDFNITIFKRGAIKITGIDKIEKAVSAVEEVKKILKEHGINLPDKYVLKVINVSISGKFDCDNIDIEKMGLELEDAFYDPDRFPAVTVYYRISPDYTVTFNIFNNGSFVCTGLKSDLTSVNQHVDYVISSFQENIIKKYCHKLKV